MCWQNAPRDASAAYLRTLPCTAKVLAALQKAYTARQRIMSNARPASLEAAVLPDQSAGPQPLHYELSNQHVEGLAISACGCWMAATLQLTYAKSIASDALPSYIQMYEVILYSTSSGCQQQARFCTGCAEPLLQWAPAVPHLGIAEQPPASPLSSAAVDMCNELCAPSVPSAAFIVMAASGSVLHALGPEASSAIRAPKTKSVSWSSNQLLLVECWSLHEEWGLQGTLVIHDVVQHTIMACSRATTAVEENWPFAAWHPSSEGLVLDHHIRLEDAGSFLQAGVDVGTLPPPFCLDTAGFSEDAKHLLAFSDPVEDPLLDPEQAPEQGGESRATSRPDVRIAVLGCSSTGGHLSFAVEQYWETRTLPTDVAWLTGSTALLIRQPSSTSSDKFCTASLQLEPQQAHVNLAQPVLPWLAHCSPSGRLLTNNGMSGLCIMDAQTGQVCWDSATAELPSGRASERPQVAELGHISMSPGSPSYPCCWQAWLPSGLGLVCSTSQGRHSPSIHVLRFA